MKNLRFDVSFMCPVSCTGGSLKYCRTHRTGDCKQEDCLHYWTSLKYAVQREPFVAGGVPLH